MTEYKYTAYFEKEVLGKRPYLKKEWCVFVIEMLSVRNLRKIIAIATGRPSLSLAIATCV
jgi:hypothetical protein